MDLHEREHTSEVAKLIRERRGSGNTAASLMMLSEYVGWLEERENRRRKQFYWWNAIYLLALIVILCYN